MNSSLSVPGSTLPSTSPELLKKMQDAQGKLLPDSDFEIQTEHILHGGMYARTIRMAANSWIMGALMKVPTILIVNGYVRMMAGEKWYGLSGFHVMPASAGRKQIFAAIEPTEITMIFPSRARTVEEAESEMTDEAELLVSHRHGENDLITITEVQ